MDVAVPNGERVKYNQLLWKFKLTSQAFQPDLRYSQLTSDPAYRCPLLVKAALQVDDLALQSLAKELIRLEEDHGSAEELRLAEKAHHVAHKDVTPETARESKKRRPGAGKVLAVTGGLGLVAAGAAYVALPLLSQPRAEPLSVYSPAVATAAPVTAQPPAAVTRQEPGVEDQRLAEAQQLVAEAKAQQLAAEAKAQKLAAEKEALALAEEQRRLEQARLAAEAEKKRLEQARLATEAEKERLQQARRATEAEKQRITDARQSAEREAQRRLAQTEKQRLDEERRKAANLAAQRKQAAEQSRQAEQQVRLQRLAAARRAEEIRQQQAASQAQANIRQVAIDHYTWEATRDIYQLVSYPQWARQFKQEGDITVTFQLDAAGELQGITNIQPADAGHLGQALQEAVSKAAPFGPLPAQIEGKQLTLQVTYPFRLNQRSAPVPAKPQSAAQAAKQTQPQQANQWQAYPQQVRQQISDTISYPFWAKDLKQQGQVAAKLTLNRDGSIQEMVLTQKARHAILNKEVLDAIARIGQFAPFPAGVEQSSLVVEFSHEFKL